MPRPPGSHPYLDIFTASLVPRLRIGPGHGQDPPAPHLMPLPAESDDTRRLLDLLLGADRDLREDHARAAALNLALAETRLRLTIAHDGLSGPVEAALSGVTLAREEMASGKQWRALAAVAGAVRALSKAPRPGQPNSMASTRSG